MKVKLKNKCKIFCTLLLMLSFNLGKSQTSQKDFYNFLDNQMKDKDYKYLLISLSKECDSNYLFTVSRMYYDNLNNPYIIYEYKGTPIIYEIKSKNKKINSFFKKNLKKSKFDVSILPKSTQSIIDATAIYFKGCKFIKDEDLIRAFMTTECQKK